MENYSTVRPKDQISLTIKERQGSGSGKNILVYESDVFVSEAISSQLISFGQVPDVVFTFDQAVCLVNDRLKQEDFYALIIIGGQNAYELAQAINQAIKRQGTDVKEPKICLILNTEQQKKKLQSLNSDEKAMYDMTIVKPVFSSDIWEILQAINLQ